MCGLCGAFGVGGHWSDAGARDAAARRHRARVAGRVLRLFQLDIAEWAGRFTVRGRTGKTAVIEHWGALWPAAERLTGRPCDPLDPAVIAAVERGPRR